jgi:hypothetical protein
MDALHWDSRPQLRQPMMIAAFDGWTDAGNAATGAASYLSNRWGAEPFASIEAEEFFDFTQRRPQVRLSGDLSREIVWPDNRFLAATTREGRDVVIMIGTEPHLRWRSFCDCVTSVATELKVQSVFTLGAMLGEVAHTRPAPVRVSTADRKLADRLGLRRPQYQGPTGIVGVLQDAFAKVTIPVGSIMAQVPHYIPGTPSPKATLAIVERVCGLIPARVATVDLQRASRTYEQQVTEAVAADDEIAGYVADLEQRSDDTPALGDLGEIPSGDALAAQLEQFLREQDDGNS